MGLSLKCTQETLLNSIIHRDYFDYDTQIQIKVFKDWLWFFNPGQLVDDLTIEQLKTSHPSKPRNKLIASVFYRSGQIEKFGSGILRITDACKNNLLPEPEFKEEFGGFSVYFKKEFTELNDRQIKALEYIRENGSINNTKYQQLCGVSRITATRDLKNLCDKNIIKLVGTKGNFSYQKI